MSTALETANRHLLPLLRDAGHARTMALSDWDETLRLARQARLLGVLGHRLLARDELELPAPVRGHLRAAVHYAAYRMQLVRMELRDLERALPPDIPVVLLKGAAYIVQSLPIAAGRAPNDVDLLVRRQDLDRAEAALLTAGWVSEVQDTYDQRYYREWSHELPPMRYPGHALQVDLHHTIAPVTGRVRVDDALLFERPPPVTGSRYLVLDPSDQIVHAALHLFQDSELRGGLRDLVDIDGLIRHHLAGDEDGARLLDRARRHGAGRALWYALNYCRCWLGTPVPADRDLPAPPGPVRRGMDWVFARCGPPRIPDRAPGLAERLATSLGQLRYHLLRMPPRLLIPHLLRKAVRRRKAPAT